MKQVVITILVVAGIIAGAVLLGKEDEAVGALSNNFYGQEDGIITVVEYGDFECPACASFFPIVSQVKEAYKDQIRFEFRHFPLVQIHPNAQAAHRAAEAAAKQGKFWEMHDLLYARQASWNGNNTSPNGISSSPTLIFEGYAEELELDIEQYRTDTASSDVLGTINADVAKGKQEGVGGTPSFFIDGEKIEDTATIASVDQFSALIDEAIASKTGEPVDGADEGEPQESEPATKPDDQQEE